MKNESFWRQQRKRILHTPGTINLNAGTMSPTPLDVLAAVNRLRKRQASNPTDFLARQSGPLLDISRASLAEYLNCNACDLLLLPNVTWGINLSAASLDLPAGSEILCTDHEYGAMTMAWKHVCKLHRWKLRVVEIPYCTEDPRDILHAIEAAITRRTRVLFFCHVTSTTGLVMPAQQLCRLARKHKILSIIDGAHAPGMIPVDLARIDADFYAANCHKWLMAPACCGFMHMRHTLRHLLKPAIISWGWGYDAAKLDESARCGTHWQFNLEFHGCEDRTPQMVLQDVLEFRKSLGGDQAILARCRQLSAYTRQQLTACGLIPATPLNSALSGAITAFEFPPSRQPPPDNWLWNHHRIECPITRGGGKSFLRVSTAWFNTHQEIDRLAAAIRSTISAGQSHVALGRAHDR